MKVEEVNFHHLRYFWAVAKDGNLTRTASRLRIAQSALSSQIHQLEEQLGCALFDRRGRRLALTEAGRVAVAYCDQIFTAGAQMVATLEGGRSAEQVIRVGAVATLSRNFQESFVKPLLQRPGVRLSLESGLLSGLLERLEEHALDLVLSNRAPRRVVGSTLRCRRVARQQVSVVGSKRAKGFRFPDDLAGAPMIVPGRESDIRSEFDAMCEHLGVRVRILAEVDDMATMRLLARDTQALALVPTVVVRDELREGALHEHCAVPGLYETFYAITADRLFQHPLIETALARDERELLETDAPRRATKRKPRG
ncbi:MAG: LysR family transcriptional regulator [Polyangiales bacterium]